MAYDLKITGGTLVDGSGAPPARGDLGIRDGRIVAVGKCPESAKRCFDADGALVTPGFIDIHTHYDGQATWDGELAPSSWHGVTTGVMGSCGVGFAPVRHGQEQRMVELMEGVEDIPGTALSEGLPWTWESFEEYMDAVDAIPHSMDLAAHVPHDALRMYVMGERGIAGEVASDDDIQQMCELLGRALDAGAVGFSTGRTDNHRTIRGIPTPAAEAHRQELVALGRVFAGRKRGVLQAVSDFDNEKGDEHFDAEFDVLEAMVDAAGGRPFSFSLMQRVNAPNQWERILKRLEAAHARGLNMRAQVAPRPIGVLLGLQTTFHPFMGHPTWKSLAHLPLPEAVAELREPAVRAQLLSESPDAVAGDGSPMPPLADELLARIGEAAFLMFRMEDPPCYEPPPESSLGFEASRREIPALEVLLDALLEDDGQALIYFAIFNYLGLNLDVVHRFLTHPLTMAGLSDGGAHVGTICDASFPTTLLRWWGRDRPKDRLPIERIVHMLSGQPAAWLGFDDRGVLAPGRLADINIIDHQALRLHKPELRDDLPAGGRRLLQRATGYRATFKSGVLTHEDGRSTGERPGRLIRG